MRVSMMCGVVSVIVLWRINVCVCAFGNKKGHMNLVFEYRVLERASVKEYALRCTGSVNSC